MKRSSVEVMVGIFVILGALALGYLSITLGKDDLSGQRG